MSQGAGTLKRVVKPVTDDAYIYHPAGFACPWCASPNVTLSGTDFTFGGDFIGQQT
ncbi:hypothetical protein LCG56_28935 (plasmid) [Pseudomonas cannabina pv. alisalensis]|uniref:Uncharacterized protein n=2 Tax=Pseudomonas syringae group TaxID=136849 RepID=A0A8T8CA56_PSEYM|nr:MULTISPECIES: hypothetical protein [Pseudomonas syringae group]QHF00419.1 hypothetical protein PMA4326_028280 [Pseudomonas syringae pv. maculicola str. ES4326]UBZ00395.1 hypothetical protein LCG56_28935 [Pseudomonas cannabina pv. alisalensis]